VSKSELIQTVKVLPERVQELKRFCHVGAAASALAEWKEVRNLSLESFGKEVASARTTVPR